MNQRGISSITSGGELIAELEKDKGTSGEQLLIRHMVSFRQKYTYRPTVSRHQAQAKLSGVRRRCQIVRYFFQKGEVSEVQILRIVNDETFGLDISHRLNQKGSFPSGRCLPRWSV